MGLHQRDNLRTWLLAAAAIFILVLAPAFAHADDDDHPAVFFSKYGPQAKGVITFSTTNEREKISGGAVASMVTASAHRHGVPVSVAHAIARIESRYRCNARSPSNARGVMQVLPATARGVGVHGNLYDCATGIDAGMRYLAQIIRQHGTGCAALALYNRGAYARPVCTGYGRQAVRLAAL